MDLMNWPPSRGLKNPHETITTMASGLVEREDVVFRPRERPVVEEAAIEEIKAAPKKRKGKKLLKTFKWRRLKMPKKRPLVGKFYCWYQVEDVASLTLEQAHKLLGVWIRCDGRSDRVRDNHDVWWDRKPRTLTVAIDYPLRTGVKLTIPPLVVRTRLRWPKDGDDEARERVVVSPGYLLWVVAKEYERIYREHEKYGVWGHAIGDLGFEGLTIDERGRVDLMIGS